MANWGYTCFVPEISNSTCQGHCKQKWGGKKKTPRTFAWPFFCYRFFLPYRFTGECDYSNKYNRLVLQTIFCMTSLPNSITSNIISRGRRQQSRSSYAKLLKAMTCYDIFSKKHFSPVPCHTFWGMLHGPQVMKLPRPKTPLSAMPQVKSIPHNELWNVGWQKRILEEIDEMKSPENYVRKSSYSKNWCKILAINSCSTFQLHEGKHMFYLKHTVVELQHTNQMPPKKLPSMVSAMAALCCLRHAL